MIPEDSMAAEVVMEASRPTPTPTVPVELLVPTSGFPMEQTQPSPFLAFTQGNDRTKPPLPLAFLFHV